jgi:hypothetical protein
VKGRGEWRVPGAIAYARRGNREREIDVRMKEVVRTCRNKSIGSRILGYSKL